jgi:hypothetical protein
MHGREDSAHKVWYKTLRKWHLVKDLDVDGSTIINKSYINRIAGWLLDVCGSGYGPVAGCCENGNEPSSSLQMDTAYLFINDELLKRNSVV